jgi:hypothetical protein
MDKIEISRWTCAEGRQKKGNKASSKLIGVHIKKQDYNETALATIAIVPDDGPMWPKHVVLV